MRCLSRRAASRQAHRHRLDRISSTSTLAYLAISRRRGLSARQGCLRRGGGDHALVEVKRACDAVPEGNAGQVRSDRCGSGAFPEAGREGPSRGLPERVLLLVAEAVRCDGTRVHHSGHNDCSHCPPATSAHTTSVRPYSSERQAVPGPRSSLRIDLRHIPHHRIVRDQLRTLPFLRVALAEGGNDFLDGCYGVNSAGVKTSAPSAPAGEAVAARGARAQSQRRS